MCEFPLLPPSNGPDPAAWPMAPAPPPLRPLGPSWPFLALWGASGRSLGRAKLCAKPGEGLAWARHRNAAPLLTRHHRSLSRSQPSMRSAMSCTYCLSFFRLISSLGRRLAGRSGSRLPAVARPPFFAAVGLGLGLGLVWPNSLQYPRQQQKTVVSLKIHPYKYYTPSHTPVSCITLIRDRPQHSIQHGVCFCLREARPICRGGLGHTTADPPFVGAALLMRVSGTVFYSATRHGRVSAPSRAPSSETSRLSRYVQHCLFHPSSPSSLA